MRTKLFLTGLALMAVTVFANAQDPATGRDNCNGQRNDQCNGTGTGSAFVDKNNDGVCDNIQNGNTTGNKGNGKCDGSGKGQGQGKVQGRNFVDANKSGICDTYEARIKK